jgi:S-formylglutathione hydrolase FrmB
MPMAWTMKYRRILGFLGRVRIIVGFGIVSIALLTLTLFAATDQQGVFSFPRNGGSKVSGQSDNVSSLRLPHFSQDTVYFVPCNGKSIRVEIKIARLANASIRRKMLLLLPGWNYADTQWCTRTRVCDEAVKRGYDVMLVEMGKSVYMDSLYPQMRADYRLHPTRTWLWDSVLKPLQRRSYFTDQGIPHEPMKAVNGHVYYKSMQLPIPCFVMGLSTGARGALLLALEHAEAFQGCAGLSGDYNPLLMKTDNLMINCLGKYEAVPWRWRGSNNIQLRINELRVPCYLAHGEADNVVPVQQSQQLFDADEDVRRSAGSSFKRSTMKLVLGKNGSHNYAFWGEQGLRALDFFEEIELK